jgi:hypothetical protein
MSIIGKKIYSLKIQDNPYYTFGIISDSIDIKSLRLANNINKLSNNIQDVHKNNDSIDCIGKIVDYSFNAKYSVTINTADKLKKNGMSNINFLGFNVYLKCKNKNKVFYIKCIDSQVFNYKDFKISAFEGEIYTDKDIIQYLPINKSTVYNNKFEYINNEYSNFMNVFNITYECALTYKNNSFKEMFLKDVDPDIDGFNSRKFGFRILKHYDFGMAFKEEVKNIVKRYLDFEFNNIKKNKDNVYNILKEI